METKFTKGEWFNVSRGGTLRRIKDEQCRDICDTYSFMSCISEEEQQANAKLIASAPDLLEALKDLCSAFEQFMDVEYGYSIGQIKAIEYINAKNAIKKATE